MRGISVVLELLLITLLLITLVSLLWFFTSGTVNAIARSSTTQAQRTQETLSTCMIVDSVYGNTVYLRNCGNGVIMNDSLNVYLDDLPLAYNMTPQTTGKGGVGTITVNLGGKSLGIHDLKIMNPSAQTVQEVEVSPPDPCVLALDFDEGLGTTAYDSSTYGNNGVLINGPAWVSGESGSALQFNGLNEYVNVHDSPSLNINGTSFTITAWIYLNDYSKNSVSQNGDLYTPILNRATNGWTGNNGNGYGLGICDWGGCGGCTQPHTLHLNLGWGNDVDSCLPIGLNKWYFVVASYSNNGSYVFFSANGVTNSSTNQVGYNPVNYDLEIGYNDWAYNGIYFNGTIDEVHIYNKALTPDQTIILKMK